MLNPTLNDYFTQLANQLADLGTEAGTVVFIQDLVKKANDFLGRAESLEVIAAMSDDSPENRYLSSDAKDFRAASESLRKIATSLCHERHSDGVCWVCDFRC